MVVSVGGTTLGSVNVHGSSWALKASDGRGDERASKVSQFVYGQGSSWGAKQLELSQQGVTAGRGSA
jgi:hypothetical protein